MHASYRVSGFTLIEFAMVALLVGLIATIVVPSGNNSTEKNVDAAAAEVSAAVRFARDESIRTGVVYGVNQPSDENRLRVFRVDGVGTPVFDVYHPVSKQLWDLQFDIGPHFRKVDINLTSVWRGTCNTDGNIAFRTDGTPMCTDPTSALLEQGSLMLSSEGVQRAVSVDGFTGRVSLP